MQTASTSTFLGKRGATRQSWKAANPRALLERVVQDHPDCTDEVLFEIFSSAVDEQTDLLETIKLHWFTNNLGSLRRAQMPREPHQVARAKNEALKETLIAEQRKQVAQVIKRKARILMMDLLLPNGKRLRACTGSECRELSRTSGRWLAAIANEVPDKKKVGEVLNEDRLHILYDAAQS
jgi:hypothetical protein